MPSWSWRCATSDDEHDRTTDAVAGCGAPMIELRSNPAQGHSCSRVVASPDGRTRSSRFRRGTSFTSSVLDPERRSDLALEGEP